MSLVRIPLVLLLLLLIGSSAGAMGLPQKGDQAPPISVTTTSGQQVTLANYQGSILLLDFFAPWCIPCKQSIPFLNGVAQRYAKQKVYVLGLSIKGGDELTEFLHERKPAYPVAHAGDDIVDSYGLRSVPTLYVIDRKGRVVERYRGFTDEIGKGIEGTIKKLLTE
jgi:thiol-disulfide isomerase/thioredoxin